MKITEFGNGSSQYIGTKPSLLNEEWFKNLTKIYNHITKHGFCHVEILEGDYKGSIAKFTLDSDFKISYLKNELCSRNYYAKEEIYNYHYFWQGRLSWKGKRNNPKFNMQSKYCNVLLNYDGEEILERFDHKKVKAELLKQDVLDIDGRTLEIGDKVLYINTRYGSGSELNHGVIIAFKADAKSGNVSAEILNDICDQKSMCNHTEYQIYKKE